MNKKQISILEKAWDAEISCALKEIPLPIIQTKSKVARQLCDDGFLDEVTLNYQMSTFKGYQINHFGIFAYCQSLPDDIDIEAMEEKMRK